MIKNDPISKAGLDVVLKALKKLAKKYPSYKNPEQYLALVTEPDPNNDEEANSFFVDYFFNIPFGNKEVSIRAIVWFSGNVLKKLSNPKPDSVSIPDPTDTTRTTYHVDTKGNLQELNF